MILFVKHYDNQDHGFNKMHHFICIIKIKLKIWYRYDAEIFSDGVNADRDATDYVKEIKRVNGSGKLVVHLSNGGGWAARFKPVNR